MNGRETWPSTQRWQSAEMDVCRDGHLRREMAVYTEMALHTQVTETGWQHTEMATTICLHELKKHCRLAPLQTVVLDGSVWFCTVLCGSVWFCAVLYGLPLSAHHTSDCRPPWFCTVHFGSVWFWTVSCGFCMGHPCLFLVDSKQHGHHPDVNWG